jgi:hypothetical protein
MEKKKFAEGIYLIKRKSKAGKEYLELSIRKNPNEAQPVYAKYLCFESDKMDNYGNMKYSIIDKEGLQDNKPKEDLPF